MGDSPERRRKGKEPMEEEQEQSYQARRTRQRTTSIYYAAGEQSSQARSARPRAASTAGGGDEEHREYPGPVTTPENAAPGGQSFQARSTRPSTAFPGGGGGDEGHRPFPGAGGVFPEGTGSAAARTTAENAGVLLPDHVLAAQNFARAAAGIVGPNRRPGAPATAPPWESLYRDSQGRKIRIAEFGPQIQWPTTGAEQTTCPRCQRPCLNNVCFSCLNADSGLQSGFPGGQPRAPSGSAASSYLSGQLRAPSGSAVPMHLRCPMCNLRAGPTVHHPWRHTCVCDWCRPLVRDWRRPLVGGACRDCRAPPPVLPQHHPRRPPPQQQLQLPQPPPPAQQHVPPHRPQQQAQPPHRPPPLQQEPPPLNYGLCRLCNDDPARPYPYPWWHGCSCELCFLYDDTPCPVCGRRWVP